MAKKNVRHARVKTPNKKATKKKTTSKTDTASSSAPQHQGEFLDASKRIQPDTLEALMLAVQKSFSRLTASTVAVNENQARAAITGPVAFNISLNGRLSKDRITLDDDGPLNFNFSGTVDPDYRVQEDSEENDA